MCPAESVQGKEGEEERKGRKESGQSRRCKQAQTLMLFHLQEEKQGWADVNQQPKEDRRTRKRGGGRGGGGQVWPSMQVIRLEGAECVLCMRMSH